MIKNIIFISVALFLSGCVAIPKINSAGDISDKNISFPVLNQKIFVVSGGMVHLKTAYTSGYRFKLKQPYQQSVQLGMASISVGSEEELIPSVLDGVEYHCVTNNGYKDLIGFTNKNVCFYEDQGKFTKVRYAPGAYWFSLNLSPSIDTIKNEIIVSKSKSYAKKELIYDGSSLNGNLIFIEKEYIDNLTKPSKLRPVAIKIDGVPTSIEVSGAIINVLEYTPSSMTFTLEKSFE
jgi:hypothetical protein